MKTITLFTIWVFTRLAWELARRTEAANRFEPLLSDASVMVQTDAEDMLSGVFKALVEA
ncbi:hypothetical protein N836_09570 [Leptolyngbya sp. Heron Island J]|uniref:hypothetical protein n=1 Tax=Leptolyngbya sp. Heron Island J TaxID=1385935 RepID=UPI0003B9B319|nr:hypothetical protein [Leptolyngbya sp. Heron Island J]ESA35958.1 hypothetical protein N836_09570 [Leptolyngbya sp. Heron Island J]